MDIAKVRNRTETRTFDFQGETITVTYRPNVYTLAWANHVAEALEREDRDWMAESLADLIEAWDLTDDGKPVPTDADGIRSLPIVVAVAIQEAIGEALTPSRAEGNASSAPPNTQFGASAEQAVTHPNGPVTSQLPERSEYLSPT